MLFVVVQPGGEEEPHLPEIVPLVDGVLISPGVVEREQVLVLLLVVGEVGDRDLGVPVVRTLAANGPPQYGNCYFSPEW